MAIFTDVVLDPDTRANQPAANAVRTGALYFVTDEAVLERSNGSAWEPYSLDGGGDLILPPDVAANRPAASGTVSGSLFFSTDTKILERSTGAAWDAYSLVLASGILAPDTRANQPSASGVAPGTLYYVTDESLTERSNGSTWETYSGAASSGGVQTTTVTITNAEAPSLSTTPKTLVAAQGANTLIVPVSIWVYQNLVTNYSTGRAYRLRFSGSASILWASPAMTGNTGVSIGNAPFISIRETTGVNVAMLLETGGDAGGTGNASNVIRVVFQYVVADVS